jgi:hypothetical protein
LVFTGIETRGRGLEHLSALEGERILRQIR